MKPTIKVVLNQIGAFIELHRPNHEHPVITLGKIDNGLAGKYRSELIERNPDMQYATIGQIYEGLANWWLDAVRNSTPDVVLTPGLWSYNASEDSYSRA